MGKGEFCLTPGNGAQHHLPDFGIAGNFQNIGAKNDGGGVGLQNQAFAEGLCQDAAIEKRESQTADIFR
jgi:hypothetical protein